MASRAFARSVRVCTREQDHRADRQIGLRHVLCDRRHLSRRNAMMILAQRLAASPSFFITGRSKSMGNAARSRSILAARRPAAITYLLFYVVVSGREKANSKYAGSSRENGERSSDAVGGCGDGNVFPALARADRLAFERQRFQGGEHEAAVRYRANRIGLIGLVACTLFAALTPAAAQTWPTKPIHFVVPYAPGGIADIAARIVGQSSRRLGPAGGGREQAGGNGFIGMTAVAKAAPDGYTLLMATLGDDHDQPGAVQGHALRRRA